jgi:hypothetical protein
MRFIDGATMSDEQLRALVDVVSSCRHGSDKAAIVLRNVRSIRDLFEILNVCFWDDESLALFEALDGAGRALLRNQLRLRKKRDPDWKSESGWEQRFIEYING